MAIQLSKNGNAIVFTFDDNDHYLGNGEISVPVNSLTLVTDESDMFTFYKAASNDIFISGLYSQIGKSKSELIAWYKDNMVGSTGGGGGVTSGEVQTMIDESVSGLSDDISTVSGDVSTLSGAVDSNHNAITAVVGDVQTLSGDVANKADTTAVTASINAAVSGKMDTSAFNTYSASTDARISEDEEVTSAALNALDAALDDKADIEDIPTVVQTTGSSSADVMSQSAVTASINAVSGAIPTSYINSIQPDSDQGYQRMYRFSTPSNFNYFILRNAKINGRQVLNQGWSTDVNQYNLVETSAITSSVTSASTDSQVPSAKAVYDALQEGGGGGGKAIVAGTNISVTTGATADTVNCTLPIKKEGNNMFPSIIIGNGNNMSAKSSSSMVGGNFSSANTNAAYSIAYGRRVITNNENEVAFGNCNVSSRASSSWGNSGNTLFSVGNSEDYNNRHNAFEIRQNGDIYITKDGSDVKLQDQLGGGGLPESAFTAYTAATDARLAEDEEVTAAALNTLNTATAANTTALGGFKLVSISQADYDLLPVKDQNTLYIITNVVS